MATPLSAAAPVRVQRRRTKGWRMPPNTVYVGRPTPWANPYRVSVWGSAEKAVAVFREMVTAVDGWSDFRADARRHLRGKNLACWCPPGQPCHADVLLEIANA